MASAPGGSGTVQRVIDHALGVAKESLKAVTRETIHSTGNFLNSASAQVLQCLPGGSSTLVAGRHLGWDSARPAFRAPQLPAWMHESATSLNKFLHEAAELIDNDDLASAASDTDDQSVRSSEDYMSATEDEDYDDTSTAASSSPHATDGGGRSAFFDTSSSGGWSRSTSSTSWRSSRFRFMRGPFRLLRLILILFLWPFILIWRLFTPGRRNRHRAAGPHRQPPSSQGSLTPQRSRSQQPLSNISSSSSLAADQSSPRASRGRQTPAGPMHPAPDRNGQPGEGSASDGLVAGMEGEGDGERGRERGRGEGLRRRALPSRGSGSSSSSLFGRTLTGAMDYFHVTQHLNDFQRRGVLEELQVLMELFIERCFDVLRKAILLICMPWRVFFPRRPREREGGGPGVGSARRRGLWAPAVSAAVGRATRSTEGMMDARTCEDIVKEAGYPYEKLRVITEDGYILWLERIPRRDSCKALFLQHGVFDSSLGWVSNGVVGSQAFAAHDQGYDVYLGNMRGYASGGHVNQNIGLRRYWAYSVNELGMVDIKAMVHTICHTKTQELTALLRDPQQEQQQQQQQQQQDSHVAAGEGAAAAAAATVDMRTISIPREGGPESAGDGASSAAPEFEIQAASHSLGGAALMVYLVTQCMKREPHHLSHVILLSPAGFHEKTPWLFDVLSFLIPFLDWLFPRFLPGFYIPTRGLRLLFNKIAQDFQNLPALGALMQVLISNFVAGGDPSDWVGSLRVPHYTMYDMPGVAYRVMKHLAQMKVRKRFCLYDYESKRANIIAYGTPEPPDMGANYGVIDISVDVVSGRQDRLIPPEMVRCHYEALKAGGCETTLQQFEYAHLDFTLAHKQELLSYVMSRLHAHSKKSKGIRHSKSHAGLHPAPSQRRRSRSVKRRLGAAAAAAEALGADGENGGEVVSDSACGGEDRGLSVWMKGAEEGG